MLQKPASGSTAANTREVADHDAACAEALPGSDQPRLQGGGDRSTNVKNVQDISTREMEYVRYRVVGSKGILKRLGQSSSSCLRSFQIAAGVSSAKTLSGPCAVERSWYWAWSRSARASSSSWTACFRAGSCALWRQALPAPHFCLVR